MSNSYAEHPMLTCPACDEVLPAEIWMVVDLTEHPELIDRICDDTIHNIHCAACGHEGFLDVPLLLYHPKIDPPLLFSPARGTTAEQDHAHALDLIKKLRRRLGIAWHEEWVTQGLQSIPRAELPAALGQDSPGAE